MEEGSESNNLKDDKKNCQPPRTLFNGIALSLFPTFGNLYEKPLEFTVKISEILVIALKCSHLLLSKLIFDFYF